MVAHRNSADSKPFLAIKPPKGGAPAMKVRAVVATQDRPRGPHAPAVRALRRAPCPCGEGAKTHTAPCRLRSAPTSRKHCGACTNGRAQRRCPTRGGGVDAPSGTPGSFIAAARQCRPDRQRQHISAAYPRSTLPWQHIDAMRPRGAGRGYIPPWCVFGRRSVAAFSLHAFPKGPRTGKAPLPGSISPPCIRNELASARYSRRASEKRRKRAFGDAPREDLAMKGPLSLRESLRSCTARRSCRRSALERERIGQSQKIAGILTRTRSKVVTSY